MKQEQKQFKKGDLVLVQPMRYCYSFAEGGIENLSGEEEDTPHVGMHWTADGFKARILSFATLDTLYNTEDYLEVKIFGKGRKHFVKRNDEKTKVIWIQQRLVTKCEDTKK
jgi:hypothetical protein